MNKKIKIWTLNAAEKLLPDPKELLQDYTYAGAGGTREVDQAVFGWDEIEAGNRKSYETSVDIKDDEDSVRKYLFKQNDKPHNLMPDAEYFVPIPAKCIGSRFDRVNDFPLLKPIRDYYYSEWQIAFPEIPNVDYKIFWNKNGLSQMITNKYIGYYDILKSSGNKHILIGYSQGGVVARFLAYLDEYVFKENIIKGIVTIGSPNYGSPLANPDNRENITDEIISLIVKILISNQSMQDSLMKKLKEKISFSDIISLIRYLIEITPENEQTYPLLITAFKWLSGLNGNDPESKAMSFVDLNIMNIEKNLESVLAKINKLPLNRVIHGSIINGNNKASEMLNSFLGLFSILIPKNIKQIFTDSYKNNFMKETSSPINDTIVLTKIKEYQNGNVIPPKSHDFISPSVYQQIDSSGNRFLGNIFNPYVNHLTGTQKYFQNGNLLPLRRMLKDMRMKLKNAGEL
ncbi:MAG: hypothetical protein N2258_06670 [Brevinematales bacterium]|nr:hypothetical protein [Brevinematales bacterium]